MKHTHKKEERRGAVICGAYGRGNAGDDAILRAIMQEMRQLDETMPMRVISRNPTETSRRFGVSACLPSILKKSGKPWEKPSCLSAAVAV